MVITYHGENYFKIQSGNTTVLIDPTNQRSFRGATLVLSTTKPNDIFIGKDSGEYFLIDHSGEYEAQGIYVQGWSAGNEKEIEKTIYKFEFDEISIVVLGHITKDISTELLEHIEECDIIIAPAGGRPWIQQQDIAKLIRQLEPALVIPSLYKEKELPAFLKELKETNTAPEEKLVIKKKDLTPHAMEIKPLIPK